MSSTGRGGKRREADFYETPEWVTARLLDVWQPKKGANIIEPAMGNAAIIEAIDKHCPIAKSLAWRGYDIRPTGMAARSDVIFAQGDFLEVKPSALLFADHVITNPPFSLAEEFLRHSRLLCPQADLVFLLRLNFLGSQERLPFWRDLGVPDVHILPNRPSFTGAGTDSGEYAWMIFRAFDEGCILRKPSEGIITILPNTPREVRMRCKKSRSLGDAVAGLSPIDMRRLDPPAGKGKAT
jgi:hypothetical protein